MKIRTIVKNAHVTKKFVKFSLKLTYTVNKLENFKLLFKSLRNQK